MEVLRRHARGADSGGLVLPAGNRQSLFNGREHKSRNGAELKCNALAVGGSPTIPIEMVAWGEVRRGDVVKVGCVWMVVRGIMPMPLEKSFHTVKTLGCCRILVDGFSSILLQTEWKSTNKGVSCSFCR